MGVSNTIKQFLKRLKIKKYPLLAHLYKDMNAFLLFIGILLIISPFIMKNTVTNYLYSYLHVRGEKYVLESVFSRYGSLGVILSVLLIVIYVYRTHVKHSYTPDEFLRYRGKFYNFEFYSFVLAWLISLTTMFFFIEYTNINILDILRSMGLERVVGAEQIKNIIDPYESIFLHHILLYILLVLVPCAGFVILLYNISPPAYRRWIQ